jgi:NAD(P)H-hydrate epimerase
MNYIASGDEMARIDKYAINDIGIAQPVLMERAAYSVCRYVTDNFDKKSRVLVVVEGGNNGGDGIAVARQLVQVGFDVEIYHIDRIKKHSAGFEYQFNIAKNLGLRFVDEILGSSYDIVIDGMFGVGLSRAVLGVHAETIQIMNDIDAYKIAVDIPSGIDSNTGFVLGTAFRADATITFGLMKLGLLMGVGCEYAGKIVLADIGVPHQAVDFVEPKLYSYDETDVERYLPYRKLDSHKGSYGKVGVIGGCKNMAGAPMFSAEAAYRMGCGLVRICTTEENREIIQSRLPEAMLNTYNPEDKASIREALKSLLKWSDVIVLGPGLGRSEYAEYIVEKVLRDFKEQIIIDADALNIISENLDMLDNTDADVIITPHLMEMSRLNGEKTGEIKENKYEVAKQFAKAHNVCVVLKDARTIVSDGGYQAYINVTGNNGMATAGAGDVLTGVIASLYAQGLSAFDAAKLGVCIHGFAGQEAAIKHGRYSMIAGDIVKSITRVLETDYYSN